MSKIIVAYSTALDFPEATYVRLFGIRNHSAIFFLPIAMTSTQAYI